MNQKNQVNHSSNNIPALRFPEFTEEWEWKKFSEITDVKSQKYNPEKEKISVKCIELEHLASETGQLLGYTDGQFSGSIKNKFNSGDVLFGKLRPYLKKYLLATFDGVCSSEIWVFKGKEVTNEFLFFLIQKNEFIDLANISAGSKMPRADWSIVSAGIFNIPSPLEQQKIASFLSAIDEKLQALKKKKSLLEHYKKGVMQKIFSQEIRFKDDNGEDFPEWESKSLGEIAERIKLKNAENNLNVLTISAQHGLISQLEFFNKSVSAKDITGYYLLHQDDFAYNKSYSNGYPMGAIKRLKRYKKGVVSTLYICFRGKKDINNTFLEQYFEAGLQNIELEKVAQEGARNHGLLNVGVNDFFSIIMQIPSLAEQTKIANFLSAIDEKISHCQTQIDKTDQYKKGLLQQMFV